MTKSTSDKAKPASSLLRSARGPINDIPGWGSALDRKMRPAVPMEKTPPDGTGAHWQDPERQVPHVKIHKSTERPALTATFGTTCPPKGVSGAIRDYAFTYSEGKLAHWLLLMLADRVDVIEGRIEDLQQGRSWNPIRESGVLTEITKNGFRARFGKRRADVPRQRNEILLYAGVAGLAFWLLTRGDND